MRPSVGVVGGALLAPPIPTAMMAEEPLGSDFSEAVAAFRRELKVLLVQEFSGLTSRIRQDIRDELQRELNAFHVSAGDFLTSSRTVTGQVMGQMQPWPAGPTIASQPLLRSMLQRTRKPFQEIQLSGDSDSEDREKPDWQIARPKRGGPTPGEALVTNPSETPEVKDHCWVRRVNTDAEQQAGDGTGTGTSPHGAGLRQVVKRLVKDAQAMTHAKSNGSKSSADAFDSVAPGDPVGHQNSFETSEEVLVVKTASMSLSRKSVFAMTGTKSPRANLEDQGSKRVSRLSWAWCAPTGLCKISEAAHRMVAHQSFDYGMNFLILSNTIFLGTQAELAAQSVRTGQPEPSFLDELSVVFFAIFMSELALRLVAHGRSFFLSGNWAWNLFDFLVVVAQLGEILLSTFTSRSASIAASLAFMRILRILRLLRIIRIVRLLRFVKELRLMVSSIASTLTSLFWTIVLLLILICLSGICFTQAMADSSKDTPPDLFIESTAYEYWGSLDRSILSLYQAITGGADWKEMCEVLVSSTSPWLAIVFTLYIAFATFAVLNVITGVFLERALNNAKMEDNLELVVRLRAVVEAMGVGDSGRMTWEHFESQLKNPSFEEYFKSIDLGLSEAESLFRLLDFEETGCINAEEFVMGCCRIHGYAKAIDLTTLMCEVHHMHRQFLEHAVFVEEALRRQHLPRPKHRNRVSQHAGPGEKPLKPDLVADPGLVKIAVQGELLDEPVKKAGP